MGQWRIVSTSFPNLRLRYVVCSETSHSFAQSFNVSVFILHCFDWPE